MAQIEINLDTPLLDISGKKTPEILSKILSKRMAYSNTKNAVKMYDWSIELWKNGKFSVDRSDLDDIKSFVENDKEVANLVKAQILIKLKDSKELKK